MPARLEARKRTESARNPLPKEDKLSVEDIAALASRFKELGDIDAQNKIVSAFQPLVRKWASYYHGKFPHLEYQELISVGSMALTRALNTFKPAFGSFGNHAQYWVRSQISEAGQNTMSDVRIPYRTRSKMKKDDTVAPAHALRSGLAMMSDSDMEESGSWGVTENTLSFHMHSRDTSIDDHIDAVAILSNLERFGLSDRQAYIFREYFGSGKTFSAIAGEFGVTSARVQQLYAGGLSRIREALGVQS